MCAHETPEIYFIFFEEHTSPPSRRRHHRSCCSCCSSSTAAAVLLLLCYSYHSYLLCVPTVQIHRRVIPVVDAVLIALNIYVRRDDANRKHFGLFQF